MPRGTVTTDITATKQEDARENIAGNVEMGKIRVQVNQVIEREGSEASAYMEDEPSRRSHRSTEDLVSRP
jgi:hypothetical protein